LNTSINNTVFKKMKFKLHFHPGIGKNPSGAGQVNSPEGVVVVLDVVVEIVGGVVLKVVGVVLEVVVEAVVVLAVV
jgi:hypothetical protein